MLKITLCKICNCILLRYHRKWSGKPVGENVDPKCTIFEGESQRIKGSKGGYWSITWSICLYSDWKREFVRECENLFIEAEYYWP